MGHHHIHTPHSHLSAEDESALRRVTLAAVLVSTLLVALKTGGWASTNAVSLLSSLADSFFDVLISCINFFALRYALKPADEDHRHGHASIEDIAGLAQFAFISGSMLFVVIRAIEQFITPTPIAAPEYGMTIMVISLLLTACLLVYQRAVHKRTGSLIVHADSLHYLGDVMMNASIIFSLAVVHFIQIEWLDPLLAIIIAIYVLREAWQVGKRAFNNLMDHEMPDDQKAHIVEIVESSTGIENMHKLKTRYSGTKVFIQMHIGIAKNTSFVDAHDITDKLEHRLAERFPGADIIIHQDPV